MKTLVVYDSVYGNTERLARAIADALGPAGRVTVLRAGEANPTEVAPGDLLIIGSPTQGGKPTQAVQDFLGRIPAKALEGVRVTSFDTRMKNIITPLFGYAAGRIGEAPKSRGGQVAAPAEGFLVKHREGPLKEGELERAARWANDIVQSLK